MQALAESASGEDSLSGSWMVSVSSQRSKGKESLSDRFYRDTNPTQEGSTLLT
jgi:hypothetical protein